MRRHLRPLGYYQDGLLALPANPHFGRVNRPMIHLQITTGRGPAECSLAVHHLTRLLLAEPGAQLVRSTPSSSIISLESDDAEVCASKWVGTILWICEDPLGSNRKRKNWYIGIQKVELPEPGKIEARDEDLKWETKTARGNGGQNVNKVETAVRLTHVPTGVTVLAEDERSQKRNKAIALGRLKKALQDKKLVQTAMLDKCNWSQHNQLERGNPVRIFTGLRFEEQT